MAKKPDGEKMQVVKENGGIDGRRKQAQGPFSEDLHMIPLEAVQLELDTLNAQADQAFLQAEHQVLAIVVPRAEESHHLEYP